MKFFPSDCTPPGGESKQLHTHNAFLSAVPEQGPGILYLGPKESLPDDVENCDHGLTRCHLTSPSPTHIGSRNAVFVTCPVLSFSEKEKHKI